MVFSNEARRVFDEAEPAPLLQPGQYCVKAISAKQVVSSTGTEGLKVGLEIARGELRGHALSRDFWITQGSAPYAKRDLALLGFMGESAEQIVSRESFEGMPLVSAELRYSEFKGQRFLKVQALAPLDEEGNDAQPRPTSPIEG